MGKIKKLLESELIGGMQNTEIYPVTSTKAVFDSNNVDLETVISNKSTVSHGNVYIKEMYLTGDFDVTHSYVISRLARNHSTYKWAIYIKDLDTSVEYYLGFSAFSEEPKFIDNKLLSKTGGSGNFYITAIINWEHIEDGKYLSDLNLPLTNLFSLEKSPFITSKIAEGNLSVEVTDIGNKVESIDGTLNGVKEESINVTGNTTMTSTLNIIVPKDNLPILSTTNEYKISIVRGSELIKPRTFGCLVNGNYYIESRGNLKYESDTTAIITISVTDIPINTFNIQVGTTNQVSAGEIEFSITNVPDEGIVKDIQNLKNGRNITPTKVQLDMYGYILFTDGIKKTSGNTDRSCSNQYPVKTGEIVSYVTTGTFSGDALIAAYDSEGSYLKEQSIEANGSAVKGEYTVPEGVSYIAVSCYYGSTIRILSKEYVEFVESLPTSEVTEPILNLSDDIYAIKGEVLQMFYKCLTSGDFERISISGGGSNYHRYWEYTPTSEETKNLTASIYDEQGNLLKSKETTLHVKAPSNPTTKQNILIVGASLIANGQIAVEVSRRLAGTQGKATTPESFNLSNYGVVGRIHKSAYTDYQDWNVGWEGTGGWSWTNYITKGVPSIRCNISNYGNYTVDSVYQVQDSTGKTIYLHVAELNPTLNTIMFRLNEATQDVSNLPQSGTLTKYRGEGDESITYTSFTEENFNPFWNNETDSFDILSYVDNYCEGHLEYLAIPTTGYNSGGGKLDQTDNYNKAKEFIDKVTSQLPNVKILLGAWGVPSQNGGCASIGKTEYYSKLAAFKAAEVYRKLSTEYDNVYYVPTQESLDVDYMYPTQEKQVNSRTTTKETIDSDGIHPAENGYWQYADVITRIIINV